MKLINNFAAWLPIGLHSTWWPNSNSSATGVSWAEALMSELAPSLSADAAIHWPGDARWDVATARWGAYRSPVSALVVQVATEADVQVTVSFAVKHAIPFLATSGGHAYVDSLGDFQQGLQIWMRSMNNVKIDESGQSATIGGGTLTKELTDALWQAGKLTVTGVCECTSIVGPMLGGGHGWMQGYYGLAADNLLEARIVLANSSIVTASATLHPDLFWAIRGAGHNFGIVTGVKYKIYDNNIGKIWSYTTFVFSGDKVEKLFEEVNKITDEGNQAKNILSFIYLSRMPNIDPDNAVFITSIYHEGPMARLERFTAAFNAMGPIQTDTATILYTDIPRTLMVDNESQGCQKGINTVNFPLSMRKYESGNQRELYAAFNKLTANPAFNLSTILFEGYSLQAVQAVPEDSTAFPDRFNNLLTAIYVNFPPNNSTLEVEALAAGRSLRRMLVPKEQADRRLYAYVNYARGEETLEELYGYESWRLQKLSKLKSMYDPDNHFRHFAPLVRRGEKDEL